MHILFLVPYPVRKAPSQRFRFEQYFHLLAARGHNYTVKPFLNENAWAILYKTGNHLSKALAILKGYGRRVLSLFTINKYDLIFIHREAAPLGPPVFEWLITKVFRKRIIYDFDDAIWIPNTSEENKIAARLKWHQKVGLICKWSYKISCGNAYLCNFARKYNADVVYNPTTIDTEHLHNPSLTSVQKSLKEKLVIGWTGSHSTLHYLDELVPVLSKLEKAYGFSFVVIANKNPALPLRSFKFKPWNAASEIEDLASFDIGVMPLSPDEWSEGKCGFKALQYMALEIPALVSPVGVNKSIIDHAVQGYHCRMAEDWEQHLIALMNNASLREELGKKGREKVKNYFSVASNAEIFLLLFE